MPTNFQKAKRRVKTANGWSDPISYATSSESVELTDGTDLQTKINSLGTAATKDVATSGDASANQVVMGNDSRLSDSRPASDVSSWAKAPTKPTYTASEVGTYTSTEIDNKFSTLETNIDWKEAVATYSDIATTYPNPVDGWTVNVKDTDYTYRYNGTSWVAISANAIPEATTNVNGLMTTTQVTKLDGISSGAEVNQNAFSKVKVGSTTVEADSKTDTLELVAGSNVSIIPDVTNDKLTINATDTTYSNATTSASGLMSATDKSKLDGIEAQANKTVVDSAMSDSSTNPLQNKVITKELEGTKTTTGNPLTIEDAAPVNAVNLSVDLEPVQDLHGYANPWVGGAGKNKWNGSVSTSNVFSSAFALPASLLNFTISLKNDSGKQINGVVYDSSGTKIVGDFVIAMASATSGTKNITVSEQAYLCIYATSASGSDASKVTEVQVESGSTATSYAPYENICPISGRSEETIQGVGKNLFGGIKFANALHAKSDYGTIDTTNKTVSFNRTSNYSPIFEYPFKENTQYTFIYSGNTESVNQKNTSILFEYTDGTESAAVNLSSNIKGTYAIQSTNGKTIKSIDLRWANGANAVLYYDECGVFEGVLTVDDFEPYAGNTYTIQLGQTVYGGQLDVTRGKMVVTHGEVDLGDLSWIYHSESGNFYVDNAVGDMKAKNSAICSCYEKNSNVYSVAELTLNGKFAFQENLLGRIIIRDTRYTDATAFKTAVTGQQLVYELATPFTIDLTPQQIKLLENTNTISTDYEGDTITIEYQPNNAIGEAVRIAEESSMLKGVDYVTAGQKSGSTLGDRATAEGSNTVSSGENSHAEGNSTTASGTSSHAEGYRTLASGEGSHAEGYKTSASHNNAHAEGGGTIASGQYSHAEGANTSATYNYSHAEGAHTLASSNNAHAEGSGTSATYKFTHAEGNNTLASGQSSHSEGDATTASGFASHAEGSSTLASNYHSHAEGNNTTASNFASHSGGHYNAAMTTGGGSYNTTGTAFVIGNGVHTSALSNAFSVQYNGVVKAASTITASTTADYAEFFEWFDENSDNEDRVGLFVTNSEEDYTKIRIANSNDDYILGIVSGDPFVLGNGDCDVWNGMMIRDDFGRVIYEPAQKYEINPETEELEPVYDDEGNPVYEGTKPVYNPEYDPTIPYISRFDRPEWSPIGMLGVLRVYDDGTCEVGGYCTVGEDGKATKVNTYDKSTNCYKVIERITDDIIKVIFR